MAVDVELARLIEKVKSSVLLVSPMLTFALIVAGPTIVNGPPHDVVAGPKIGTAVVSEPVETSISKPEVLLGYTNDTSSPA